MLGRIFILLGMGLLMLGCSSKEVKLISEQRTIDDFNKLQSQGNLKCCWSKKILIP